MKILRDLVPQIKELGQKKNLDSIARIFIRYPSNKDVFKGVFVLQWPHRLLQVMLLSSSKRYERYVPQGRRDFKYFKFTQILRILILALIK